MNNCNNPYAVAFASAARRRQEEIQRARRKRWINEQRQAERDNGAMLVGIIMLVTVAAYATIASLWIF